MDADLDNILLMALRKEPQRRYASVEQLASDLRNYLTGHAGERARQFAAVPRRQVRAPSARSNSRREYWSAARCSVRWCFRCAKHDIAERERHVAQQHFDSVRKLANTMLFQLHDEMAQDAGSLKSREMLVKTSLEYLDALYKQGGSDPQLQEELANAYIKVASIQGSDTEANRGNFAGSVG